MGGFTFIRGNYWTTGHIPGSPIEKFAYDDMVRRIMGGEPRLQTTVWLVSKDERLAHCFNRDLCVKRLTADGFGRFLADFEAVIGGSCSRGFAIHVREKRRELLLACSVRGNRRRPDIFGWKIGVASRNGGQVSVVDVGADVEEKDEVEELVESILF